MGNSVFDSAHLYGLDSREDSRFCVERVECRLSTVVFFVKTWRVLAACVSIFAHRVWYFHNLFCVFFSIERCKYRLLISLLLISMN